MSEGDTTMTPYATTPGEGSDGGRGNDSLVVIISLKDPDIYLPIYVMTGLSAAIFIIVPLLIPKGPNQGLIRASIWVGTFSMWILWFTVYVAQMNPLVGPRVPNTTLAWIAHSWGKSAKLPTPKPITTTTESTTKVETTTGAVNGGYWNTCSNTLKER